MKNTFTLFLAITTIALGAVCLLQRRNLAGQKTQLTSVLGELEQKAQQIDALQASQERLENQRSELRRQADDLLPARQPANAKAPALASTRVPPIAEGQKPDPDGGGLGKILSKMMDDPETKKFIRDQQRQMLDPLYGPLIQQMGLTPEEAETFKDVLADNVMKGAEKASSLLSGVSSTNRTEMLNTLAAEQNSFDEQLKAFLGDPRYAQYKDYQQTVGERMQLNQFRQQTAGSENPLTNQQMEQLLVLMNEEKQNVAAAAGQPLPGTGQDDANLQAMLSGDQMERLLQAYQTVYERTYERAGGVLSPDQLNAFGRFQTNTLQAMRLGMTLFAPKKTGDEAAQPNQ
jgi:hypothetical protein